MNYHLSDHAQREMLRRQIPLAWIESVMASPDQVMPGFGNRKVYQSRIVAEGKVYLVRVVVEDKQSPPTIITVYRTSKIEKYWRAP